MPPPLPLAPALTDTTFFDLRAALRSLDDPAVTRSEGQRGIGECLAQLKLEVCQVKITFARRLQQIQEQRVPPPVVILGAATENDGDDRFKVRLIDAQLERDRECHRMHFHVSTLQHVLARHVACSRPLLVIQQRAETSVGEESYREQHFLQMLAELGRSQDEIAVLTRTLARLFERDRAQRDYLQRQHLLMLALRDVAVESAGRRSGAEHRVQRLQSDVIRLQKQLDERDDVDDEIESARGRILDLERALSNSEHLLRDERRESDQLRLSQVHHEQRWLERLESLRSELDMEQDLWIKRRQAEYDMRFNEWRQSQANDDAELRQAHAAHLQQLCDQHDRIVAEVNARSASLEVQLRDLQLQYDPKTVEEVVDRCRKECEAQSAVERAQWSETRASYLDEHEQMRTELATLRGQLNRAKFDENDLRARYGSVVGTLQLLQAEADQRVVDTARTARESERALFQEQLDRRELDHVAVVEELKARLAHVQDTVQEIRDQAAESKRYLESELQSSRVLHERTMTQMDRALADAADAQQRFDRDVHAIHVQAESELESVRAECAAVCCRSATQSKQDVADAEARAEHVLQLRLDELRATLQESSEEAKRAVAQMAQVQLDRAREEHDATIVTLHQRLSTENAALLEAERVRAGAEHASLLQKIESLQSEMQSERDVRNAELCTLVAAHERQRDTLQAQLDARQVELCQAHDQRISSEWEYEHALADAERMWRVRASETELRHRDLSQMVDQQRDELDRERARSVRKLRYLQQKLEAAYSQRDARVEDRNRINELEMEAVRTGSSVEQLANEIRFYKFELANRDQALAGKYGATAVVKSLEHARVMPTKVLRSASVVDVNSQAGFSTVGPVRPRRVSPLPRT